MIYVKRGITVVVLTYSTTSSPPFTSGKAGGETREDAWKIATRGESDTRRERIILSFLRVSLLLAYFMRVHSLNFP